ncbi:MAG: FadR/GntR family transcriptional regulator [Jatrophihabitans sp.]
MTFTAARSHRLYEDVVRQIVDMIDSGQFQPGARLPPEREIAQQIAVSRNVLREAFRVLEERGLVFSRQGGGRYVRAVAPNLQAEGNPVPGLEVTSILDVLESRSILEGQIVALACRRVTAAEGGHLREIAKRGRSWQDNVDFHVTLAAATHNFLLQRVVREHLDLLHELRQRDHYNAPERGAQLHREHLAIADAVVAGDVTRAQHLMLDHLGHTQQSLDALRTAELPD